MRRLFQVEHTNFMEEPVAELRLRFGFALRGVEAYFSRNKLALSFRAESDLISDIAKHLELATNGASVYMHFGRVELLLVEERACRHAPV